ncbi:MAG: DUF6771 family protein [Pseudomonadota bacterium]
MQPTHFKYAAVFQLVLSHSADKYGAMNPEDTVAKIAKVIANAPDWLRQDLASKDTSLRTRAEETPAAMITAALRK